MEAIVPEDDALIHLLISLYSEIEHLRAIDPSCEMLTALFTMATNREIFGADHMAAIRRVSKLVPKFIPSASKEEEVVGSEINLTFYVHT
jgi:hypothetical protein